MSPPRVTLVFEYERRPQVVWDADGDGAKERLLDWLASQPVYQDVVVETCIQSRESLEVPK
jgi:hypothetical protein